MNRAEMIMKATDVLPYHWRVNPPGGECSCGHVTRLGGRTSEHVARAVLDAVLPQVTTAAELDALTLGTIVVSHNGYPFERAFGNAMSVGGEPAGTTDGIAAQFAPLTVVWTPEVTS